MENRYNVVVYVHNESDEKIKRLINFILNSEYQMYFKLDKNIRDYQYLCFHVCNMILPIRDERYNVYENFYYFIEDEIITGGMMTINEFLKYEFKMLLNKKTRNRKYDIHYISNE